MRAGAFYYDLKTRAEGEIFKSDKTQTASILTSLFKPRNSNLMFT